MEPFALDWPVIVRQVGYIRMPKAGGNSLYPGRESGERGAAPRSPAISETNAAAAVEA